MEGPFPLDIIQVTSIERGYPLAAPIDFHMTTLAIREPFNPIAYELIVLAMYENGVGTLRGFPALVPPLVRANGNAWRRGSVVPVVPRGCRLHTHTACNKCQNDQTDSPKCDSSFHVILPPSLFPSLSCVWLKVKMFRQGLIKAGPNSTVMLPNRILRQRLEL